ncbi:MAG: FkbM family methyltransferase [Planctomycetes bacterium]|nr:FkbM family methyltransferase [Planctomycetota bacterium]
MKSFRQIAKLILPARVRRTVSSFFSIETRRRNAVERMLRSGNTLVEVPLEHGILRLDLRDRYVARELFIHRTREPEETNFLRSEFKTGRTIYDIGANIGYITTMAARYVGPTGRVYAFEPDPSNVRTLKYNVDRNSLPNVTVFTTALGDRSGSAQLFLCADNYGDHRLYDQGTHDRVSVDVPVSRLDELIRDHDLPPPDVIKIDVQGYEAKVFAGLGQKLDEWRPLTILTEYWPAGLRRAGDEPKCYLDRFRELGYEVLVAKDRHGFERVEWAQLYVLLDEMERKEPEQHTNLVFRIPPRDPQ